MSFSNKRENLPGHCRISVNCRKKGRKHISQVRSCNIEREGTGNTLQYSCLGNPTDRGVWQATVSPWGHKELGLTEHACTHTKNTCPFSLLCLFILSFIYICVDVQIFILFIGLQSSTSVIYFASQIVPAVVVRNSQVGPCVLLTPSHHTFFCVSFFLTLLRLKMFWARLVYFLPQCQTQSFLQGEMALFFLWPCPPAFRILVLRPGIEPMPPAVEAPNLNQQAAGEVLRNGSFYWRVVFETKTSELAGLLLWTVTASWPSQLLPLGSNPLLCSSP